MVNDNCQSIRDRIEKTREGIRKAENILPELQGPVKEETEKFIKREKLKLKRQLDELEACEANK